MTILGLDHYNLAAPKELLEDLRTFYTDIVGLTVGERPPFDAFGYWLYAGEQPVLHLSESEHATPASDPSKSTFNHAALRCSELADVEQRLRSLGISYRTARIPGMEVTQLFFSDPAGNGVELNFPEG